MRNARNTFALDIRISFDGWTVYSDEAYTDIVRDEDMATEVQDSGDMATDYDDWASRTKCAPKEVYAEAARRLDWEGIPSGRYGWVAAAPDLLDVAAGEIVAQMSDDDISGYAAGRAAWHTNISGMLVGAWGPLVARESALLARVDELVSDRA